MKKIIFGALLSVFVLGSVFAISTLNTDEASHLSQVNTVCLEEHAQNVVSVPGHDEVEITRYGWCKKSGCRCSKFTSASGGKCKCGHWGSDHD